MATRFSIAIQSDTRRTDAWVNGKITTQDGKAYSFCAKVFDEESEFGIRNGRVSKLFVREKNAAIVAYDRGWDVRPASEHKELYKSLMKFLNDLPPVGEE